MNHSNKKRTFLILLIVILLPILFIFVPTHTFTKQLHSQNDLGLIPIKQDFDEVPTSKEPCLNGADGPYIFQRKKKTIEVQVVPSSTIYQIVEKEISDKCAYTFTCHVDNKAKDQFNFTLRKDYKVPPYEYAQPEKLLAISDFEGNFNAFYSLLIANEVMDTAYNWTYGKGHLVIAGDMMDRGVNVTQCLWLIYKLEEAAEKVGGQVHFILGNHEVMNLHGITEYVEPKYVALAMQLFDEEDPKSAYLSLMSRKQELVKWMRSKNIMEKIGDMLFVHGGISSELVESNLKLKRINYTARRMLSKSYNLSPTEEKNVRLLSGVMGPLWYRGMVARHGKKYDKATPAEVQKVLKRFEVKHVVIGHTPMNQMGLDYDGAVVTINLLQPDAKFTGKAKAFLMEDGVFYSVNDLGVKLPLSLIKAGKEKRH